MDQHLAGLDDLAFELDSWRKQATDITPDMRSVLQVTMLTSANRLPLISRVLRQRLESYASAPVSSQAAFVEKVRESLLKCSCLVGMPR
ncbi:hypothetical protein EV182_001611, partial [Spiromyces aspiralis]